MQKNVFFKNLRVTAVILLGRKIGYGQQMTPLNFEVTRSKVKVTVAFNAKTCVYSIS